MAPAPGQPDLEALARQLEAGGDYRVLRRFAPRRRYAEPDALPHRTAVALDVETTGLDPRADAIIQLAVVAFDYSAETGTIFDVGEPLTFFEDPQRPIPAEIVKLTGITDADVAGKRIDDQAVETLVRSGSLVLAHNAAFDRPFLERRLPCFQEMAWGCSVADVPWRYLGYASSSQESLLMEHCAVFYDAHRADSDALALVHLLATPLDSGDPPLKLLLQSARKKTLRLWAVGAPFDAKDALKARRYRWNNGDDRRPKAWWRDVREDEQAAEERWLSEAVYGGASGKWKVEIVDARTRYSDRG
jgi:DNA polymerase III subunit epsilon